MPCMCFYDLKKYIVPIEILFYLCYIYIVINRITKYKSKGSDRCVFTHHSKNE